MVVRKRKKNSRMRASHTHGWGSKKRHRGAGARSGRGNAGRGKRSCHKKPSFQKREIFLGHKGFVMHGATLKNEGVNLEFIQDHLQEYVLGGKVEKKGDIYLVDVEKLGFVKVLGSGELKVKLHIKAAQVSGKAEEKIKKTGGEIIPIGEHAQE